GYDSEEPEAAGMLLHHRGAVIVELAREVAGFLDIAAEPYSGLDNRQDGGGNAALVHVLERRLRRPCRRPSAGAASCRRHGVGMEFGNEVMMNIDSSLGRRPDARGDGWGGRKSQRGRATGQEIPPSRVRGCAASADAEKRTLYGSGAHPCLAELSLFGALKARRMNLSCCLRPMPAWASD